ncbi:proton-coupled amino acid transporter 1-like [Corticium candelabrum]|uniref:proton-coupled amino acid transporter 1-like n=1 Tax=Corticium candelabrum TaxID=121492 RepID=UPI002E270BA6|nr:proton-coupled amino acid transporter 1-like [Corticium candelabrum]
MSYSERDPLLSEKHVFSRGAAVETSSTGKSLTTVPDDNLRDRVGDPSDSGSTSSSLDSVQDHSISNVEAFMHLVKGLVGTGILGLPHAFMQAGLLLGPLFTTLIAIACTTTAYMLVISSRTLCKRSRVGSLDYAQTVHAAALPYSSRLAYWLKIVTNIFLIIVQFGFCCVYVVFISEHIVQVAQACGIEFGHGWSSTDKERIVVACLFLPLALATYIKNLDRLSFLSTAANVVTIVSFGVVYYFTIGHMNMKVKDGYGGPLSKLPLVAAVSGWPLFLGTVIYAIEGIGVVMPIENKMKQPLDFGKVLVCGFTFVSIIYVITGLLGYMCFGQNIQGSVTLNLPVAGSHAWLYAVVKVFLIFAIFCSYLIQFYVPLTFLEPPLEIFFNTPRVSYIFRTLIVAITCALAIAIPDLGDLISLVGSLGGSTLLFVFPIIAYQLTFRQNYNRNSPGLWMSVLCIGFLVIGVIGFVLGTYSSLKNIIESSNSTHPTTAPS